MKQPNPSSRDEWMNARVEAYVDDDLSGEELARFERILNDDEYWQTQVRQARQIKNSLHDLPKPSAPAELTRSILQHTSRAHRPLPWWKNLLQQAMQTWRALVAARRRPVVDYAVGLAFVAVAAFFIILPLTDDESTGPPAQVSSQLQLSVTPPYSQTDVERAETKAKWTFGYITEITRRSPQSLLPDSSTTEPPVVDTSADPVPNVIPETPNGAAATGASPDGSFEEASTQTPSPKH